MQDFTITISPRLYETDAMGHINNASIAAWFEVLRVRFLEDVLGSSPSDALAVDASQSWILASVHIDYKGETFYGKDVTARVVSAEMGDSSLKVSGEMEQDGRQTVRGYAVLVNIDLATRRPVRIADGVRALLGQGR